MAQRHRSPRTDRGHRIRRQLATALGLALAAWSGLASAQVWNAGTGSWLDALNWTPQQVPLAGGFVTVSNNGVAQLTGVTATPVLAALNIGLADSGTGRGSVISSGAGVLVGGGINVGSRFNSGSFAEGVLDISGAGAQAAQVNVGFVGGATAATGASGTMRVEQALALGGGLLQVGQMFNSAAGSSATGSLTVGSHGGTVGGFLIVGNVSASSESQLGSVSTGSVDIGGNLALAGNTFSYIGTTIGTDRNADGSLVNRATGSVTVGGTLTMNGTQNLLLGRTDGGVAHGALSVATLDMAGGQFNGLSVGTAGRGQAQGSLNAGSGDLRMTGNASVGITSNGTAEGTVQLEGGQLLGNSTGSLRVGNGNAVNGAQVRATGRVEASGGVAGFNSFEVGVLSGQVAAGSFADGTLIGGASAPVATTGSVNVGSLLNFSGQPAGAGSARGEMVMGNSLAINNSLLQVGQMFDAGGGSTATGSLTVGGHGGTVGGFMIVGNVSASSESQLGSVSTGSVDIGGNLALAGSTFSYIGTTIGTDRNPDGSLVNRAAGSVTVGGTLTVNGTQNLLLGRTDGGVAHGALSVATLDMAGGQFNGLSVGTAGRGQAQGSLNAGSGDLRMTGNASVGTTSNGTAEGTVQLDGGQLLGNSTGSLRVGNGNAVNGAQVRATGRVEASGGVAGYNSFEVGVLSGQVAAGSFADGTLIGGASAPVATTGSVNVGSLLNFSGQPAGAGSARGEMVMGNSLVINNSLLQVGQMFDAGGGSTATGSLTVGGHGGTVGGFLVVGNVSASSESQLGSVSTGSVDIGGNLALAGNTFSYIGTTFGTDRNATGTLVNRATGSVTVGGTLTLGASQSMSIGQTSGGVAHGALSASVVEMALGRLASLNIGISGPGNATGSVDLGGGTLGVQSLLIGHSAGGSAYGRLALSQATLEAGRVFGGTGGGVAEVVLNEVSARVEDDFELLNGLVSLDRSLLDIGDRLALGAGTELRIGIDGLTRGIEFGAIDALSAELDGLLAVDFSDLVLGGSMVFDLLRTGSSDGIAGNFSGFSFTGLQAGYSVWHGIELDGVEVYRLRIARNDVPEPASPALVLLALGLMAVRARRGRAVAAPLRSQAPG